MPAKLLNALFVCIALPLLLFMPGAVLWRSVLGRYERVRRFSGEVLGPWTAAVVQVAASMLVTGWVGFVLGEVGVFSRYLLVAIVAALSVAGLLAAGRKPSELFGTRRSDAPAGGARSWRETVRGAWSDRGMAAGIKGLVNNLVLRNEWFYAPVLLVVAAFLFTSPMRTVWRGHEAGRHLACGIALAERGSFRLDDAIGEKLWPETAQGDASDGTRLAGDTRLAGGTRFAGDTRLAGNTRLAGDYRVSPRDPETIYPAFLHFGATWIAIGHSLLGRWGALHVTAFAAIVGIVMFFLFVRAVTSVKVALLATVLLVLNFAQSYFVRTSSPAVIAQCLVWTAFLFLVLFVRLEIKPFGMLAGVALGQLVLTGQHLYPALLVGWVVFVCSTYQRYHAKRLYRFIVFPFLLFVFQPALFDTFLGTYYTRTLARGLTAALVSSAAGDWTSNLPAAMARLGGIVGLIVFAVMTYRAAYRRNARFREGVRGVLAWRDGLALRLAGAAVALAYVVVFAVRQPPYVVEGGVVVHHAKWFYQFLDELGFGFFLLGVGLFIYFCIVRKRQPGLTLPFTVFFLFLLTAIWNPMTSGTLMHGAARLVPLYLPFAYFFVAYSLLALREVSGRLILGEAVKVLVAILAVMLPAVTAREQRVVRPWERHKPERDILGQYDEFFRREPFPRDAIVLFDASLAASQVPLVMQTLYYVDSIMLDGERADPVEAGALARRLAELGRPVFYAHDAGEAGHMPQGYIRGPDLEFVIETSILEEKVGSRPHAIGPAGSRIVFVKLEPEAPADEGEAP